MNAELIFKISLTALLSINYLGIFTIGKQREPNTPAGVFVGMVVATIIIYGLWNWV
jgi:hypothetical protein